MSLFVPRRSMLEYDSENLNSEEIYSSLRGVTEAIQNFSFRSQEDLVEPLRRDSKRDGMVRTNIQTFNPTHSYNIFTALVTFFFSPVSERPQTPTRTSAANAPPWTTRRHC